LLPSFLSLVTFFIAFFRRLRGDFMFSQFRPALILLAVFTILTGLVYPVAVTALAQVIFPAQANGSLIVREGQVVGSELIGQPFDSPGYFWGRLSATGPFPYNAAASSGSNYGPINPALEEAVTARIDALRQADPQNSASIPVDLVTASGSGLDPHISVAAARYQVPRVALARGISEAELSALVEQHTGDRQLWFLGEPRVNVLLLNLALDEAYPIAANGIE
jgi:K+-transporting ATPase ATPase C chain